MAKGGARAGAGRPKGSVASHTLLAQEMRKMFIEKMHKEFAPIVDSQIEAAKGLFHAEGIVLDEVTGKPISARIVKEKPDTSAGRYLLDQSIGKAKETIEHQGEIKGILQIVSELESA